MTEHFATSPFGGRMMNAAHFLNYETLRQSQKQVQSVQADSNKAAKLCTVDRWKLLRALTEARESYQISHRTISVLEVLLSFYGDKLLDARAPLIVFPSNHELSMRLRGMSAPTIRRHLAHLVQLGFILRRDSPNGKRFVRRNSDGEIAMAFGFDLAPLVFKAAEIEAHAEQARDIARKRQQLRFTITIHLRDIAKTIAAACLENRAGDWIGLAERLQALSGRVERNGSIENLTMREHALGILRHDVENLYVSMLSESKMSASEHEIEHHIQNSNIEYLDKDTKDKPDITNEPILPGTTTHKINNKACNPAKSDTSLKDILTACPQIAGYAARGIHNWADLMITAGHIRSMLGITNSAWQQACFIMGDINAAITIAAILERSETIHSAGGYLRKLTERAAIGQYSIKPVLRAIENTRH